MQYGSSLISKVKFRDNFVMIGQKGLAQGSAVEQVHCSLLTFTRKITIKPNNDRFPLQSILLLLLCDVVLETSVFVSRCLEDKNESLGLGS